MGEIQRDSIIQSVLPILEYLYESVKYKEIMLISW